MALVLIFISAILDRARGGGFIELGNSLPARLLSGKRPFPPTPHILYGWAVAALCSYGWDGWLTAAIILGWVIGERPGWGAPIGQIRRGGPRWTLPPDPNPERYQLWFGDFMHRHPLAALAFRGAFWGLPVLLLALPFGVVVWEPAAAMAVAMPVVEAAYFWLQRYDPPWPRSWRGGWNEFYRGGLFGTLLAVESALESLQ